MCRLLCIFFSTLISFASYANELEIKEFAKRGGLKEIPLVIYLKPDPKDVLNFGQINAVREASDKTLQAVKNISGVKGSTSVDGAPLISLTAKESSIPEIIKLPFVVDVFPNYPIRTFLDDAIPLTNIDKLASNGDGTTTVIIDTGIERNHQFLSPRVIDEGCFTGSSSCGTGPGAAAPCTQITNCNHGTHVAGIAAGNRNATNPKRGASSSGNIVAIQVFDNATGNVAKSSYVAIVGALTQVRDYFMLKSYVTAVNMSIGSDPQDSLELCKPNSSGQLVYRSIVKELRAQGIAVVVASGNNSNKSQIAFPSCIPEAIAVGNSEKSDTKVYFESNAGLNLDVLAPGTLIRSSLLGNSFGPYTGTSMAAPLVAGGISSLRSDADWPLEQIEAALVDTGKSILDTGNQTSYPRVDFQAAQLNLNTKRPVSPYIYIKDTPGDTGLEPDPHSLGRPLYESVDIWVRNQSDGFTQLHQHQNPEFGQPNYIYAKVRNRGGQKSAGLVVAYFVPSGNAASDSSQWVEIGRSTVHPVLGSSSTIYEVLWPKVPGVGHFCILVKWFPEGATPGLSFNDMVGAVANDKTLVWRNLNIVDATAGYAAFESEFGFDYKDATNIVVQFDGSAPEGEGWYLEITLPREVVMNTADPSLKYAKFIGENPVKLRLPIKRGAVYLTDLKAAQPNDSGNLPIQMKIGVSESHSRKIPIGLKMKVEAVTDVNKSKVSGVSTGGGTSYIIDL